MTFGGLFALCNGRQPIPLGPTSTFFVTDWLRTAGGWDPHNRTAQADLGVRIRRLGGRVAALDGIADHVVETDVRGWLRRCLRCVAGYTQTYLVHMRRPRQLREELGLRGFVGFQCAVAGTALAFVVYPILWSLVALWSLGLADWVPRMIPGPMHVGVSVLAASTAAVRVRGSDHATQERGPGVATAAQPLVLVDSVGGARTLGEVRAEHAGGEGAQLGVGLQRAREVRHEHHGMHESDHDLSDGLDREVRG